MKIKNKNYRAFLDNGIINTISEEDINRALSNIKGRNTREARALLIMLYYTGGRPNEVLKLKGNGISFEPNYILVKLEGSKGGLPRTIYLRRKLPLIKELYKYVNGVMPEMFLFYSFKDSYTRSFINKKGVVVQRKEISNKLRYHFKKWFSGILEDSIPPYYLRHNRFSKLAQKGATIQDIRMLKGSKTDASVMPYLHLSSKTSKDLSKKMD